MVGCLWFILLNNSALYGMVIFGPGVRVATVSASQIIFIIISSSYYRYGISVRKAKNLTSSPFFFYINVLAFQGRLEGFNAYAAALIDLFIRAGFRNAAFLIRSIKISTRHNGSGPQATTSTLDGIPLMFYSQRLIIFKG